MLSLLLALALAQDAVSADALKKMPVREVTVFKDGHALLLHQGEMPVDAAGHVVLDGLPTPVVGTFWAYSSDRVAKLAGVTAGRRTVRVEHTALNLIEMIDANPGAQIFITDRNNHTYAATVVGIPRRERERAAVLELQTIEGFKVVPLDSIQHVTFRDRPKEKVGEDEDRHVLTMRLDWGNAERAKTAGVGMMYLQRGLRWIPSYKVELDGKGRATVRLQATILNELADLENVTAHLVIGVPSFAFKETPDPVALQRDFANLSRYFQQDSIQGQQFSNSMMTQVARMGEHRAPPAAPPGGDAEPRIAEGAQKEDLYVFPVKGLTLKKGEVAVVPVAEFTADYKDVWALDIPVAPPREARIQMNEQQRELSRLLHQPKVMHKVRLVNASGSPFTTAPALLLQGGQTLGQGMMTYTSPGAHVDLEVTAAVDIQVRKSETETERTPNARSFRGESYDRVDASGKLALTNYRKEAVEVEVTRRVLGDATAAGGKVDKLNLLEDGDEILDGAAWWRGYWSWPWWWPHLNPVSRLSWKVTLEPGKPLDLGYSWHYFWR
jgi:hypothetical protein